MNKNSIQNIEGILYCKADGSYTKVFYRDGKKLYCSNLKWFTTQLDDRIYIRCHHSYLVNVKAVIKLDIRSMHMELENGHLVPVSKRRTHLIPDFKDFVKI